MAHIAGWISSWPQRMLRPPLSSAAYRGLQLLMTRRRERHQQLLLHAFGKLSHGLPAKMMISS